MLEFTIYCDGCGCLGDASSKGPMEARRSLREERGWTTQPLIGDLCPECAENHQEEAA